MTLEQMKMLKLVAEQGSLRGASEIMFKTQPAISQGIKKLENQLGVQLFDRDGYRLELTAQGRQIYQHALRLLNEAAKIWQLSHHLAQGNEASITLAFEAAFDLNRVMPLLEVTQTKFPDTQIILKQEYLTGAVEALHDGEADLAISIDSVQMMNDSSLDYVKIYQGFMTCVASPRLLTRHADLQFAEELRNEYQILVQDTGQGTKGRDFGVQTGQRRWYVNDFSTKKTLILGGMGWGRLPNNIIEDELEDGSLVKLKLKDAQNIVAMSHYAMKLKSRLLGPVANKLWENLVLLSQKDA